MTPKEALKQYFGYDSFHPGQEQIIDAILSSRDAMAVMPTGAGKSVCYQVPALVMDGITLVISPLISLMQDQVKALNAAGVKAAYINSSLTEGQTMKALRLAMEGTYRIIYVAPERLTNSYFLRFATNADIAMVTVDEAHCISQWGQDFRPSYLGIVDFIRRLSRRPIISAFTATATEEVREDIRCILGLEDPEVVVTGFDRPNLYFEVDHAHKKDAFVLRYVREHASESGIIYCATRKNVDKLFELLFKEGVSVARYHAGMETEERKYNQNEFVYDRIAVMVATNAFGMGIDKSNVRYVIHYNMPQSMENYYQEAGRAGRDGEKASCILLFSPQDVVIDRFLLEQKDFSAIPPENVENIRDRDSLRLRVMEQYCQTTDCLRNYILRYFGESVGEGCGNCANCLGSFREVDMTVPARCVLNCVWEGGSRFGVSIITGTLIGANRARLREIGANNWKTYGKLAGTDEGILRDLITQLVGMGYLEKTDGKYSVLRIGPEAGRLKDEGCRVMMKVREKTDSEQDYAGQSGSRGRSAKGGAGSRGSDSLTSLGFKLFEELRALRLQIAREQNLPPYIVFTDKTLIDMCVRLPRDEQDMLDVSGVARAKYDRYGEQFLEAVRIFCEAHQGEVISTFDREAARAAAEEEARAKAQEKAEKAERKKAARRKAEFSLSPEEAEQYVCADFAYVTDIKNQMNQLCAPEGMKKLKGEITTFLKEEGLIVDLPRGDGYIDRQATEKGLEAGIIPEERVSANGVSYVVLKYPPELQRRIVEHFVRR